MGSSTRPLFWPPKIAKNAGVICSYVSRGFWPEVALVAGEVAFLAGEVALLAPLLI